MMGVRLVSVNAKSYTESLRMRGIMMVMGDGGDFMIHGEGHHRREVYKRFDHGQRRKRIVVVD